MAESKKKKGAAPEGPVILTGSFCFPNGDKYSGEYTNDANGMCRNGQGTHTYANGKVYVGAWKGDKIHGQGCLSFPNGSKYEGAFVDNAFNGDGVYFWEDGSKFKGKFSNNKLVGQGEYTDTNNRIWVGNFQEKVAIGLEVKLEC